MSSDKKRVAEKGAGGSPAKRARPTDKGKAASVSKKAPSAKPAKEKSQSGTLKSTLGNKKGQAGKGKALDNKGGTIGKVATKGAGLDELMKQVLSIWEDLRPRNASTEVKQELVGKIIKAAKGRLKDLAVKSKASRVIQALLKHGTKQQKDAVWQECKDHIIYLAMSPYGNHVVRKFISGADKEQLSGMVRACKGSVVKLFRHPCGSPVLTDLYDELQTAERNVLVAEFYSREVALLGPKASTLTLNSLTEAWPEMDGLQRRSTMQRLIQSLHPILEKAYVDPPPIHRLVSEYMQLAPSDMLQDCVENLSGEAVIRMVHTHDGCRVGCMVAAYSTPKQRKKLVKAMKGHVTKFCADEFAYVTLIKVLESVDDTELVRKTIVAEIQNNLEEVLASLHGIKVVLSMVSSLSKHLPPHAKDMLSPPERTVAVSPAVDNPGEAGEDSKEAGPEGEPTQTVLGLSKKDPERKRSELVRSGPGSLGAALLGHCTEHVAELLQTAHGGDLVACLAGDSSIGCMLWESDREAVEQLHEAIAAAALHDANSPDGITTPLLEHFFASRALKRMAGAEEGDACEHCAQMLWDKALHGTVEMRVGTHAAKIVAALAQRESVLSQAVKLGLKPIVDDVDSWINGFKGTRQKKPKRTV